MSRGGTFSVTNPLYADADQIPQTSQYSVGTLNVSVLSSQAGTATLEANAPIVVHPELQNVPQYSAGAVAVQPTFAPGGQLAFYGSIQSTAPATGGQPYVPPPQRPIQDSLHPLREWFRKKLSWRIFSKKSQTITHKVESPKVQGDIPDAPQIKEAEEKDTALKLTMFEYPSRIEEQPLTASQDGPESTSSAQPESIPTKEHDDLSEEPTQQEEDDENECTYIDSDEKDALYPLRKMHESYSTSTTHHHAPSSVSKTADTIKEVSEEVDNGNYDTVNNIIPADQFTELAEKNDEHTVASIPIATDQLLTEVEDHANGQQVVIATQVRVVTVQHCEVLQDTKELSSMEEKEYQCTVIDEADSDLLSIKKEIEEVMPKEDCEMYVEVVDCIVTSLDKKRCSCVDCFNSCCCSLSCENPTRIFKDGTKTKQIITKDLQIGAQNGWKILMTFIFPLVRPFVRDLIAIVFLLVSIVGLILSIISVSTGSRDGCNIFRLICTFLSTIFSSVDTIISLKNSKAFEEGVKRIRTRRAGNRATNESGAVDENPSESESQQLVTEDVSKETSIVNIQNRDEPDSLKKGWDVIRLVVLELVFYPLLLCDLIAFIVNKRYRFEVDTAKDIFGVVKILYSFFSKFFFVYLLRMVILIAMIYHIHKKRRLSPEQTQKLADIERKFDPDSNFHKKELNDSEQDEETLNREVANAGLKFQIYFAFHVAGQMAAQFLMIVAISITVDKENENIGPEDHINISSRLWFMMASGYILPFIGIFSFFVPTFYWTYEHPNGICINVLSLLEKPGFGHIFSFNKKTEKARAKVIEIAWNLNKAQLKADFLNLRNQNFSDKLFYPVKSPFLVVVCLAYSICQFAFVLTAILAIRSGDPATLFFYILSITVGIVANVYVFAVAALWTTIIVGIIALIAIIVAVIMMICVLAGCGSSDKRN